MAEVEVESVAYIVCDALGLDTGDLVFAYVARWSNGASEVIKETRERVIRCAKRIVEGLESTDKVVSKPREKGPTDAPVWSERSETAMRHR